MRTPTLVYINTNDSQADTVASREKLPLSPETARPRQNADVDWESGQAREPVRLGPASGLRGRARERPKWINDGHHELRWSRLLWAESGHPPSFDLLVGAGSERGRNRHINHALRSLTPPSFLWLVEAAHFFFYEGGTLGLNVLGGMDQSAERHKPARYCTETNHSRDCRVCHFARPVAKSRRQCGPYPNDCCCR